MSELRKIDPYTGLRMARSPTSSRPKQGARLAALRKAAGLSQAELARTIGVPQQNVAYWETTNKPPRSEVLPTMAKALGVRVEDLLGETASLARKPGPVGRLQRVLEKASDLPRRDQQLIADFVETLVERHKKAS